MDVGRKKAACFNTKAHMRGKKVLLMKKLVALFLTVLMLLSCAAMAEEMLGGMTGGWTPSADPAVTEDIQELLFKGLDGLLGVNYTPVAYLGSQVVAGTNHAILCQATVVYPDATPYYVIVYLYQDLEGNVSILNIADFDVGSLCDYGAEAE